MCFIKNEPKQKTAWVPKNSTLALQIITKTPNELQNETKKQQYNDRKLNENRVFSILFSIVLVVYHLP